jgi:hypothetical protein
MNQALLFYGLRLLSAIILLAFLAAVAWLVYQDLRLSADLAQQQRSYGHLRVIASEGGTLGLDTLFPLIPVTSIGRAPGNTVVIDDGYVSNEHVLITRRGKQWWLEDLGSRNGTLLNDLWLTEPVVISVGDVIVLGGTRLKIEPESNV